MYTWASCSIIEAIKCAKYSFYWFFHKNGNWCDNRDIWMRVLCVWYVFKHHHKFNASKAFWCCDEIISIPMTVNKHKYTHTHTSTPKHDRIQLSMSKIVAISFESISKHLIDYTTYILVTIVIQRPSPIWHSHTYSHSHASGWNAFEIMINSFFQNSNCIKYRTRMNTMKW